MSRYQYTPTRIAAPATSVITTLQSVLYPKVARLVANYILIKAGYLPAVVHSIERQRYYEALRHENDSLAGLILESLQNGIETTAKFYEELQGLRVRRAS